MTRRTAHKATETDVPALTKILNDAVAYKLQHGDSAWGKKGWTEQGVLDSLSRSEVYVIEQNGLPVATMSLSWSDEKYWGIQQPNAGYVHRIAVKAGLHGLGLGGYAVEWSGQRIKEKGLQYLRLDCDLMNADLCQYYESLGFARVGTRPIPALGDYVASLYEKSVP